MWIATTVIMTLAALIAIVLLGLALAQIRDQALEEDEEPRDAALPLSLGFPRHRQEPSWKAQ